MEEYVIYFDGACEWSPDTNKRNPGGLATYGWVIYKDGNVYARGYGVAKHGEGATNNVAEYVGLIKSLEAAVSLGIFPTLVRGDSQLVIRQINGEYKVNADYLRVLWDKVKGFDIGKTQFEWVPRKLNEYADDLSKYAYNKARNDRDYNYHYRARLK